MPKVKTDRNTTILRFVCCSQLINDVRLNTCILFSIYQAQKQNLSRMAKVKSVGPRIRSYTVSS